MKEFKFKCIEDNIGLEEDRKEIIVEGDSFNNILAPFLFKGMFCTEAGETDPSKIIVHEEYFDNEEDYAVFKLVDVKKTQ